jgi:phosphoglycerate dehydrogenase-like enzyme
LVLTRRLLDLGRTGPLHHGTTASLSDLAVGIVGLGPIGAAFAEKVVRLGATDVRYWSRTRKPAVERSLGVLYAPLPQLLRRSTAVSVHINRAAGTLLGARELRLLPDGAIVVNTSFPSAVDVPALAREVRAGRLRAAFDAPPDPLPGPVRSLPARRFNWSKEYVAYDTQAAAREIGNRATASMLNLLARGRDPFLVNPEYTRYRMAASRSSPR